MEGSCPSGGCEFGWDGSVDYDHKISVALEVDFLFTVAKMLRLGPSLAYGTTQNVDIDGAGGSVESEIGSDLALDFMLEVAIPVAPKIWIAPGGRLGLLMLFPAGDLDDEMQAWQDACENDGTIGGCDNLSGARMGFDYGLGVGAIFGVADKVRLRGDLVWRGYSVNVFTLSGDGGDETMDLSGGRVFLMAGAEFL